VRRTTEPAVLPKVDGRQAALRELVEVLINEPRFAGRVEGVLDPAAFSDPVLGQIARAVVEWCRAGSGQGHWRLDELVGRFGDPAVARVVTDLQAEGERRGNYEATVEGALRRIREAERMSETTAAGRAARCGGDRETETRALAAVTEGIRAHQHFSPLSRIARPG